jgi:flagellar basal-body rod protein FlgF
MDRSLYVAMTGAMQTLRAQTANSHNLANASTVGFRALLTNTEPEAIPGAGLPSRVNAVAEDQGWDSTPGTLMTTGRDLDVAVRGDGWIAIQTADGSEAYTRAGDLRLTPQGQLTTAAGHPVLGEGGPVSIPPNTSLSIGEDGTIAIVPPGQSPATLAQVGRIRVMNIAPENLQRGGDGLMRLKGGAEAQPVAGASLVTGALETSNVNPAEAMVTMIQLARQFEMQSKVLRTVEENATSSTSLLSMR